MNARQIACLLVVSACLLSATLLVAQDSDDAPTAPEVTTSINDLIDPDILAAATDDDGWVNYYDVYVATMTDGLTAENNGARQLVMAFGPDDWVDEDAQADWLDAMGLTVAEFPAARLQPFDEYWEGVAGMAFVNEDRFQLDSYDVENTLTSGPWTADDWPEAAMWVSLNEGPLDLVVEATEQERLVLSAFSNREDEDRQLLDMLVPALARCRQASQALATRAMGSLGEGDVEEAIADVQAIHRLATKMEGGYLLHRLVSAAVERIALRADLAMLRSDLLTEGQLEELVAQLSESHGGGGMIYAMAWEQAVWLDVARGLQAEMPAAPEGVEGIDWRVMRDKFDAFGKRQLLAFAKPTYIESNEELITIRDDLEALQADLDETTQEIEATVQGFLVGEIDIAGLAALEANASGILGDYMLVSFFADFRMANKLDYESRVRRAMTAVAAGCELYRLREGEYPADLAALAEAGIMDVPADAFTGGDLAYFPANDHCIIYSLGPNGQDDGGLSPKTPDEDLPYLLANPDTDEIPTDADDIAIVLIQLIQETDE